MYSKEKKILMGFLCFGFFVLKKDLVGWLEFKTCVPKAYVWYYALNTSVCIYGRTLNKANWPQIIAKPENIQRSALDFTT